MAVGVAWRPWGRCAPTGSTSWTIVRLAASSLIASPISTGSLTGAGSIRSVPAGTAGGRHCRDTPCFAVIMAPCSQYGVLAWHRLIKELGGQRPSFGVARRVLAELCGYAGSVGLWDRAAAETVTVAPCRKVGL